MTSESVLHFSARTAADAKLGKVECAPRVLADGIRGIFAVPHRYAQKMRQDDADDDAVHCLKTPV